ncbi:DNA polymerase III subunit delta [Litorilituus lipolyticus]|uniref:DNA polymerase III subunit delta n=1 Tax=Litorilituus lipolyticus TaxID=2491017 RepID=A0A502L2W3_9GAMM|nr:DNA polymerase III subunit delta [Litorilituus lipolyticus]TPH14677.1 DNA polymerase III subunit delta [Litorilituus lipolyticus]
MKIYHNQLEQTLRQRFIPVWLVFGDEPWQKDNSLSTIKNAAKNNGFEELIRFSSENSFDWQQLLDEYQSMSLFASQRIIEVELTSGKIGDAGSKVLIELTERLTQDQQAGMANQDVIFIFHGNKLDGATANRKWFKGLNQLGCYLPLYDLDVKSLPRWLNNQARQLQLNFTPEVSSLLLELFEGNLPALSQELQKLSILFGQSVITLEQAENIVINQAKFNPFQIIDVLLQGDCKKCIRILDQLQQEGAAVGQLIWVFHKEIHQLYLMLSQLEQGKSHADLYKQYRIWDKRKPLYQHALTHISLANVQRALTRLADIDLLSKSQSEFNVFLLLADLCVTLYHGEITEQFDLNYG